VAVRTACIAGSLDTAEELLTKDIDANADDFDSYASRSLVKARKGEWDNALQDAVKVRYITYRHGLNVLIPW